MKKAQIIVDKYFLTGKTDKRIYGSFIRTSEGLIGMQVHVGPPMKIEFRNIRLKTDRKEVSGR